jgi:hypothetical protein
MEGKMRKGTPTVLLIIMAVIMFSGCSGKMKKYNKSK